MRNRKCFGPYETPVAWTDYQKRAASVFRRLFRKVRPDHLREQLAELDDDGQLIESEAEKNRAVFLFSRESETMMRL